MDEKEREESEADQLYQQIKEKQKSDTKPFVQRIPHRTRLYIGLAIIFFVYYVTKNDIEPTKALLWAGVGAAVIYLLYSGEEDKRELNERECRVLLEKNISWLQENPVGGQYHVPPDSEVVIGTVGRKLWLGDEPWKRQFKVMMKHQDGTTDTYSADVDIYNGDIIGMRERPAGYTGSEPVDIRTIAAEDLRQERYRDQYLKGKIR